jgi:hypothetical protein
VSFAAITLCVAFQRVFIIVFISLSTQSGNFWIHTLTSAFFFNVLCREKPYDGLSDRLNKHISVTVN